MRIKSAADSARDAALSARLKLLTVDILASLDRVVASVRDLQFLHRSKFSIPLLHSRYEATTGILLALQADLDTEPVRYTEEARVVRSLLNELSMLQEAAEDYPRTKSFPDRTKANITLNKLLTLLQASREKLRAQLGGSSGQ